MFRRRFRKRSPIMREAERFDEIEKETKIRDGKSITLYEAEVKKPDGKKIEIEVAEDGKLIKVKDD